jgi:hypothetical protein
VAAPRASRGGSPPPPRLQRVPEAFREQVRISVESFVRDRGESTVEGEIAEAAFVAAREMMCPVDHTGDHTGYQSGGKA